MGHSQNQHDEAIAKEATKEINSATYLNSTQSYGQPKYIRVQIITVFLKLLMWHLGFSSDDVFFSLFRRK